MANNKVQLANGTVLIDITDTTAVASDVAAGKYFYNAAGVKTEGTASGGGSAVITETQDPAGGTVVSIVTDGGSTVITETQDPAGGTVVSIVTDGSIDLTETTATAADVASGKYFFNAAGVKTMGTASGGSAIIDSLTVTPATSQQVFNSSSVDGYKPVTVEAMPSGTEGTPTATKGTVSNHSVSVTPSVTNGAGYIAGGTHTGTAVSVSASELVSGSETKTSNGTYDVTNLASLVVNVPTGTARTSSDVTVSGDTVSVPAGLYSSAVSKSVASGTAGTPTATKGTVSNHSVSITPSVTNTTGYITGGTKTGTPVTVYASDLVSGSETKTSNGTYVVTNLQYLVVNVPIVTYYTGSSAPSSSLGSNGDIYLQTS